MAGKLTIRRVGTLLPHLCLAGVLLFTGIFIWLSTAGLPSCALRYIEQEAAKAGLPITIDKIQLEPSSGLAIKIEGIGVSIPQQEAAPATLRLRKLSVLLNLTRLLNGDYTPSRLTLKDAQIQLPLSQETHDSLKLAPIDLHASFLPEGKGLQATLNTHLHGVELECKLGYKSEATLWNELFSATPEQESSKEAPDLSVTLGECIGTCKEQLRQVKDLLEAQQWTPEQHPHIKFQAMYGKAWKLHLDARIPRYDDDGFHIRDARLQADFEKETLTISTLRFQTIDPDTRVSLQGAYDLKSRELEFYTRSNAPIVRMLNSYLDEDPTGILQKINSAQNTTPLIELNGRASFSEDYALNNITLRGKIEHEEVMLGQSAIQKVLLSFFMRDGSFNIDNLLLEFPQGHLKAAAQAADGTGFAKLDINLPAETILTLARDLSNNDALSLPEGLNFGENLKLVVDCDVRIPPFEPGKSRFEDLIPSIVGLNLQFNTGHIGIGDTQFTGNSLTLTATGINYDAEHISAKEIRIDALSSPRLEQAEADDVVISAELHSLQTDTDFRKQELGHASLHLSAKTAAINDMAVEALHTKAKLSGFILENGKAQSQAISATLNADTLKAADNTAKGIHLEILIPEGINLADIWKNMQKDASIEATIQEISHLNDFCAQDTQFSLKNIGEDTATLLVRSGIGEEKLTLQAKARLQDNELLHVDDIQAHLPLASLLPLFGGEPIAGIKLPKLIEAQGQALFHSSTGQLINSQFHLHLPQLVRVCNNIHVFKGREIPLDLDINGHVSTAADGQMHYAADVTAKHELGTLDIHVTGNPLSECRITGTNTLPVDIINALIDNADAHWIMRDFRCTPGVTRNNITDIDTNIRYDHGLYVHSTCKAELINMEFLLGALRDKEDAQGKPTGEEYLRTDLSPNPYTLVKEGHCDVEVLVQLDCTDEAGNPLPELIRINLLNPDLLYDNTPWLKRMGWKSGVRTSRITGEAVRFDIENNTISLHKLKGTCYPAYSIGMYYAPIQHFMEDIILRDPVDIETDYCIFPLSRNCDVPMQGLIRAEAATGAGFRFLGTTIPFTHFSGFINISDADVYLDRMNAQCWGGVMNGAVRIGFSGEHTSLDGYIQASNMNLKDIVASYGEDFTPATCNGFIRFQAPEPELEAVRAYGKVSLTDGDLMQLGLFRPIGSLLSDMPGYLTKLQQTVSFDKSEPAPPNWADKLIRFIFDSGSDAVDTMQDSAYKLPFANHFLRYGIDSASSRFDIRNGHLITRNMVASGYNLDVRTKLDINLNTLTLTGNLWPQISSVPTVLISPITILSNFLIDINLHGDLVDPQWKIGLSKKLQGQEASLRAEPKEGNSPASDK